MIETNNTLTVERARQVLRYDKKSGEFWRIDRRTPKRVGTVNKNGRFVIRVDYILYYAHRLAVLLVKGRWPEELVDHKDTDPTNNRWRNLREGNQMFNLENLRRPHRDNKCGILGVHKTKRGTFCASISVRGKKKNLGEYDTPHQAGGVYLAAKRAGHAGNTL